MERKEPLLRHNIPGRHRRKSLITMKKKKSRLNHFEAIEYNKDCCSINQRNESRRKSHVRGGGKEANHIKKIKIIKG
jgi:hypothetical protein